MWETRCKESVCIRKNFGKKGGKTRKRKDPQPKLAKLEGKVSEKRGEMTPNLPKKGGEKAKKGW